MIAPLIHAFAPAVVLPWWWEPAVWFALLDMPLVTAWMAWRERRAS